ncbi:DeoR/GlpR family DNA-binding transcription regulator [Fictibacillus enclensis]|uniref:DeoR/GlpR family DNA-binding transcription regulator n=1 Tax=Fictibacillus enclensis TaxID=1017270 RepID=UPI0025A0D2B0|nr:DeoR/GlpR family DNA-binding transcription regulator [Fictibacillus enclensis]MDM5200291.1 DeoR/GlpR family DNA-binding transcription regulator [Fictibacillus enclensis]
MYQDERMEAILHYLKEHERVDMETICNMNNVSRDTARRDLVKLEEEGKIVRLRGGAKSPTLFHDVSNYDERLQKASEEKKRIGKYAAGLILDGDHLLLDASTTVQFLAENIQTKDNVVVTNSIDIAGILSKKEDIFIHLLGGLLNNSHRSIYGSRTIQHLTDFKVNKLFLGACGISSDGLTIPFEEEGFLLKEMISRSDQVILLADSSKFNRTYFQKVCGWNKIDILVTDQEMEPKLKKQLEQFEIEIIVL